MRRYAVTLGLASAAAVAVCADEALDNASFSQGMTGWTAWSSDAANLPVSPTVTDGRDTVYVEVFPERLPEWGGPVCSVSQRLPIATGAVYEVRFALKATDASNGWGAFGEIAFLDRSGEVITESRTAGVVADGSWQEPVLRALAPPGTVEGRVSVYLQGAGRLWIDAVNASVAGSVVGLPAGTTVDVRFATAPLASPFLGFGFEDDGFAYDEVNRAHGVTDEDLLLRERRIRWLDPDVVRMLCWYGGWWPKGTAGPETYDFDSPYMQSFCRTLSLYQSLGAKVNLSCAEWGTPVFDQPEKTARALGELLEELIKRRGFSCIAYWTAGNEPDVTVLGYARAPFSVLSTLQRLVKEECVRRGLDIQVIGSDDANNLGFFRQCVETPAYHQTVDLYSSHFYPKAAERVGIPLLLQERLSLLGGSKALFLGEFGFLDAKSSVFGNPHMDTYECGLQAADLCIRALNIGVSGLSMWTVHEMYYHGYDEGRLMAFGLWGYKDRDWLVKPVYHAFGMFPRLTEPGEPVYPGTSSAPDWVQGVRVGNHMFLTNESPDPVRVVLGGPSVAAVRVYEETTLHGEAECGRSLEPDAAGLVLPGRSFAWASLAP